MCNSSGHKKTGNHFVFLSIAIEPAAHFDPGSEGHDIYGKTGHALARVCVPLQPQTLLDRLQTEDSPPGRGAGVEIVKTCKVLLAQYLSGSTSGGE